MAGDINGTVYDTLTITSGTGSTNGTGLSWGGYVSGYWCGCGGFHGYGATCPLTTVVYQSAPYHLPISCKGRDEWHDYAKLSAKRLFCRNCGETREV